MEWGILGGELWRVRDESTRWDGGLIPQRPGPPAVYTWVADRLPSEPWPDFESDIVFLGADFELFMSVLLDDFDAPRKRRIALFAAVLLYSEPTYACDKNYGGCCSTQIRQLLP
jgi:hypothetical protein